MQSQTYTEDGEEGEPGQREVIFICRTNTDLGNGEPKMSFQLTPLKCFFFNKELVFLKEIKGRGAAGGQGVYITCRGQGVYLTCRLWIQSAVPPKCKEKRAKATAENTSL